MQTWQLPQFVVGYSSKAIYPVEKGLLRPAVPNWSLMDPSSDAQVYAALKRRRADALGILYDRYGGPVYRLALRILTDRQEAEDLTQEVFLHLWDKLAYDPARGSLNNYLLTLTRSRAIDRLRSRASKVRSLQRWGRELTGAQVSGPLERVAQQEWAHRVREALQQLPDAQRKALELAYYEGLSQSEIAQKLEAPLGTIKTRCRQGLLKLRELLRELVG